MATRAEQFRTEEQRRSKRAKEVWLDDFSYPEPELFHPDWTYIRGNPDLQSERGWSADAGFELESAGAGPPRAYPATHHSAPRDRLGGDSAAARDLLGILRKRRT